LGGTGGLLGIPTRTITNVGAGRIDATSTDAINGSELYATNQAVEAVGATANEGWNLSANGGTGVNIAPGATVDVAQGTNIVVTQDATTGNLTIATSDTPVFTSVTTGNTVMDVTGVTITGGANGTVSLTNTGLDNGGNKIVNVADGTDPTDAVNLSQLDTAVAGATTHYYSVNDGGAQGGNYNNDGATGVDSLAAGVGANAVGTNSVAVGSSANAAAANGVAIGIAASTVSIGDLAIGS